MVLRQRRSWRPTQFSRQRRRLRHRVWRLERRNSSAEAEISRRNRHRPRQALHCWRLSQRHPLRPDLGWDFLIFYFKSVFILQSFPEYWAESKNSWSTNWWLILGHSCSDQPFRGKFFFIKMWFVPKTNITCPREHVKVYVKNGRY